MENEKKEQFNSVELDQENIIFTVNNVDIIVLNGNGDIFVKGELITNSEQVVSGMREFLQNIDSQRVMEYKERIDELDNQISNLSPPSVKPESDAVEFYEWIKESEYSRMGNLWFSSEETIGTTTALYKLFLTNKQTNQ